MEKITDIINVLVAEKGNEYTVADVKKALACAVLTAALLMIATAF